MTSPPLALGHGHIATFTVWMPDRDLNPQYGDLPDVDPFGIMLDHPTPDGAPCTGSVIFDSEAARRVCPDSAYWTVESLDPLTLSPSILCGCGDHGYIREGRWVPA